MESLPHVVGAEVHQWPSDLRSVQRQRNRTAVGEEGRSGVPFNHGLIDVDAGGILGVEQSVQMPSGDVSLRVMAVEAQKGRGTHLRAEEGNVVVIGIEDAGHGAAAEANGIAQVGGIDVTHSGHGTLLARTRKTGLGHECSRATSAQ